MEKKLKVALILVVLIIMGGSSSSAVTDSRHQWWKLQKKHLETDMTRVEKDPYLDKSLLPLLRDDLRRCSEVLRVFRELSLERGLLTEEKGLFAGTARQKAIERNAAALADMLLLKTLTMQWNSRDLEKMMGGPAVRAVRKKAASLFTEDTGEISILFLLKDVAPAYKKAVAREMLLQAMKRERPLLKKKIAARLSRRVEKLLSTGDGVTSLYVKNLIARETSRLGESFILPLDITATDEDLAASATWDWYRELMDYHFTSFKEIKKMVKEEYPLGKIRYFFRDPAALDRQLFPHENITKLRDENQRIYLHRRIDRLRRTMLISINSRNASAVTRQFTRKGNSLVNQYLARDRASIRRYEKMLKGLEEKAAGDEESPAALRREIARQKKQLSAREKEARDYLARSEDLLSWRGDNSAMPREKVRRLMRKRISGLEKYIEIIRAIGSGASGFSGRESRTTQAAVRLSLRRLDVLYRDILQGAIFPASMRSSLRAKDIRLLMQEKRDLAAAIHQSRESVITEFQVMNERRGSLAEKREARSVRRAAGIAQFEMDQVAAGLKSLSRYLARLHYGEDILARYKVRVDRLVAALGRGEIPPETDDILKKKSLLHLVQGYSAEAFKREGATKKYLAGEIRQRSARVRALVDFYRRRGIEIREFPTERELRGYRRLAAREAAVVLASQRVTLENLHEADRRTATRVRDMAVRNIWKEESRGRSRNTTCTLELEDRSLLLSIPYGWERLPGAKAIPGRPRIKEFLSLDGTASIILAAVPEDKKDAKEVTRRWMIRRSSTMMTHRWGKNGASSYYWVRGRDRHMNVFELYAFERDGHVVIIEGSSPGDKYHLLQKKLQRVFESVRY